MRSLELTRLDRTHLEAAEGWLGLGNYLEANEEIESISAALRTHPDVLRVRHDVYSSAKKWEAAAEVARAISELVPDSPFGYVHLAYALHEMKRTQEAWDVLLPVVDKFPDEYIISYNLASYACRLGKLKESWGWLAKAIDLAGTKEVKLMALDDPDLKPLWADISQI